MASKGNFKKPWSSGNRPEMGIFFDTIGDELPHMFPYSHLAYAGPDPVENGRLEIRFFGAKVYVTGTNLVALMEVIRRGVCSEVVERAQDRFTEHNGYIDTIRVELEEPEEEEAAHKGRRAA